MKATKNIMKVRQKDLFEFKKNHSQDYVKPDPTTKMKTVTISSTQSISTIFM